MDRQTMLSLIKKWSSQMGLTTIEVEDPTTDFHLSVSEPNLPIIEILHQKSDSAFVLFAARVSVSEEHQKKMLNLELEQRENVLWEVRLKLLSMNVDFKMIRSNGGVPTAWEIYSKLFLEGAIAQHFSDTYLKVKNAVFCVIWLYKRHLEPWP